MGYLCGPSSPVIHKQRFPPAGGLPACYRRRTTTGTPTSGREVVRGMFEEFANL